MVWIRAWVLECLLFWVDLGANGDGFGCFLIFVEGLDFHPSLTETLEVSGPSCSLVRFWMRPVWGFSNGCSSSLGLVAALVWPRWVTALSRISIFRCHWPLRSNGWFGFFCGALVSLLWLYVWFESSRLVVLSRDSSESRARVGLVNRPAHWLGRCY